MSSRARAFSWARRPFGIFKDPDLGRRGTWIARSALVGAVSGCGAILFDLCFRFCQWAFLENIGGFLPPGTGLEGGSGYAPRSPWLLPISLVLGGLIAGALVFGLAPEAEGHGTDAVVKAFHHLRGKIRRRVPPVKALASAITIGSGGSGGREGPIAQIGAGFGSYLADLLKLGARERRILMLAGVAGGIGSIFRAPLGAALFSAEVLYSEPEFEYLALMPGLISAIVGYCIYCSYAGWGFLFDVPAISFHRPRELPTYIVLGLACGLLGIIYTRVFYGVRDRIFHRIALPAWVKPALGAAVVGGIAVLFPEALGMGYGYIQQAIQGRLAISFLIVFALVKILATSFTISSGGSGGVFGPSLVIGGALGAAFGQAAARWSPGLAPDPVACTMVGMGGFFAGVAKVPFASVIMVMEMTGSYGLLVPSLLVAAVAYLFVPLSVKLYENQLPSRQDSPAHAASFLAGVLRRARLKDFWQPSRPAARTLAVDQRIDSLASLASETEQRLFPVLDERGKLVGEIAPTDLPDFSAPAGPMTIGDIMRVSVGPLTLEDNLATASRLFSDRHVNAVTVVTSAESRIVVGVFDRRDLMSSYQKSLHEVGDELTEPAT